MFFFFFKNYSLVKVIYVFIRCHKARFFLRSTNNTDRNGVNKKNMHTHTHTHIHTHTHTHTHAQTKDSEKDSTGKY